MKPKPKPKKKSKKGSTRPKRKSKKRKMDFCASDSDDSDDNTSSIELPRRGGNDSDGSNTMVESGTENEDPGIPKNSFESDELEYLQQPALGFPMAHPISPPMPPPMPPQAYFQGPP
ncbi:hypothetical protein P154DRAFT_581533 [Amniculicola lignicola CBS 123094]|uniref:Uncharacterized protein n=1 Tax=Amniculicola lignicola CBS 123094 TaxID=1392246 RepID=A0A6A5W0G9_9PLEO|nr:hypothetical protein P154DRAFT_581533 [Amniculicola lignicola CBS 123094]